MLGGIVKRDRLIEMRPAFRDVPRTQQGNTHEAMPDHERDRRSLLLGKRQELRRKLAHHVAVERHVVRDPEAVEDREQQQRIFGRLSRALPPARSAGAPARPPPWFPAQHSP